jgi:pre-mRNA-splicing factor 38A
MANSTDPFAQSVHGTNPQYLIEKITRQKIYNCVYWKEQCFGLTSETILDKAIALKYIGGTYGGNLKPTNFLCLVLKLLQLQPELDIVLEFVKNEDFKYLRALGAFYLRLVGKVDMIYQYLEPLLNDYRKISYRGMSGWQSMHMDEFVDSLLREELVCDMALPHLVKRMKLEELGTLLPRKSALDDEIANAGEDSSSEEDSDSDGEVQEEADAVQAVRAAAIADVQDSKAAGGLAARTESADSNSGATNGRADERSTGSADSAERGDRGSSRKREDEDRRARSRSPGDRRARSRTRDSRDRRGGSRDRSDRRSDRRRSDSEDRDRRRDRSPGDRHRDDRGRRDERSRHRRSPSSGSDYDRRRRRDRSSDRHKDRSRDRDSRRDHRDDRHRRRSRSPSSPDRRRSGHRRSFDRRSPDRYRKRDRSPDRSSRGDDREDRDGKRTKPAAESDDDWMPTPAAASEPVPEPVAAKKDSKSAAEKKFDRMFGGKGKSQSSAGTSAPAGRATTAALAASGRGGGGGGGKEIVNSKGEKVVITAPEGSVEYWNQMREALGMKKLK